MSRYGTLHRDPVLRLDPEMCAKRGDMLQDAVLFLAMNL